MNELNSHDDPVCGVHQPGEGYGCSLSIGHFGAHKAYWDHEIHRAQFIAEWERASYSVTQQEIAEAIESIKATAHGQTP